jgi:hypothetical protein
MGECAHESRGPIHYALVFMTPEAETPRSTLFRTSAITMPPFPSRTTDCGPYSLAVVAGTPFADVPLTPPDPAMPVMRYCPAAGTPDCVWDGDTELAD